MRVHEVAGLLLLVATAGQALASTPPRPPVDVEVTVELRGFPKEATLAVTVLACPPADAPPIAVQLEAPGSAKVQLEPDVLYRLSIEAQGAWAHAEPVLVRPGQTRSSARLVLWRAGVVSGRFKPPGGIPPPSICTMSFHPPPDADAQAPPSGEVTCPVAEGAWRCSVPTGRLDLRVRAEGFVSHYFWDQAISPEQPHELGVLTLVPGASVAGWVRTRDSAPLGPECTVELTPLGGAALPAADEQRLSVVRLRVQPTERGFFHLAGVPPGGYAIRVSKPGYAPAELSPLFVVGTAEATLRDDIVLDRPLTALLRVEPATDPWGRPWRLRLFRATSATDHWVKVGEAESDPEGGWPVGGLAPATYRLKAEDADGNSWASEEFELAPDKEDFTMQVPAVPIEGAVKLGRKPLMATLWFGGAQGVVSVRVDTDREGAFTGFVPREGDWDITVAARFLPVRRELRKVEVRVAEGRRAAFLDLSLTDTEITGVVVDEEGKPAAGAMVTAKPLAPGEGALSVRATSEGRFELDGLPTGRVSLEADKDDATSEPLQVQLDEGVKAAPQTLVLRRMAELRGSVTSAAGPVLGAYVVAFPLGRIAAWTEAVTGLDGRFALRVPAWTSEVLLASLPPGYALHTQRIRLSELRGADLALVARADGGTLTLDRRASTFDPKRHRLVIVHDGSPLPMPALGRWAALSGARPSSDETFSLPPCEPGEYAICLFQSEEAALLFTSLLGPPGTCTATAYLPPHGSVTLRLPSSAK